MSWKPCSKRYSFLIQDETCVALVDRHDIIPLLINLLALEIKRLGQVSMVLAIDSTEEERKETKDHVKSIIQVIHAVVGTFKNLSLASQVRNKLGACIDIITELLSFEGVKVVQFGAVGILKNLSISIENTFKIVTSEFKKDFQSNVIPLETPLYKIVEFLWKCTEDSDASIRSEGGRLFANLIKTCHQAQGIFY